MINKTGKGFTDAQIIGHLNKSVFAMLHAMSIWKNT